MQYFRVFFCDIRFLIQNRWCTILRIPGRGIQRNIILCPKNNYIVLTKYAYCAHKIISLCAQNSNIADKLNIVYAQRVKNVLLRTFIPVAFLCYTTSAYCVAWLW